MLKWKISKKQSYFMGQTASTKKCGDFRTRNAEFSSIGWLVIPTLNFTQRIYPVEKKKKGLYHYYEEQTFHRNLTKTLGFSLPALPSNIVINLSWLGNSHVTIQINSHLSQLFPTGSVPLATIFTWHWCRVKRLYALCLWRAPIMAREFRLT